MSSRVSLQMSDVKSTIGLVASSGQGPLFFYGHAVGTPYACFSQWYKCTFSDGTNEYNCAEQYMMAAKARLFGDYKTLALIMSSKEPRQQKASGRKVRPFDKTKWDAICEALVVAGNRFKFQQNPALLKQLLDTGDRELVEASPSDAIWGIGLSAAKAATTHRSKWGQNLLGKALVDVRRALRTTATTATTAAALDTSSGAAAAAGGAPIASAAPSSAPSSAGASADAGAGGDAKSDSKRVSGDLSGGDLVAEYRGKRGKYVGKMKAGDFAWVEYSAVSAGSDRGWEMVLHKVKLRRLAVPDIATAWTCEMADGSLRGANEKCMLPTRAVTCLGADDLVFTAEDLSKAERETKHRNDLKTQIVRQSIAQGLVRAVGEGELEHFGPDTAFKRDDRVWIKIEEGVYVEARLARFSDGLWTVNAQTVNDDDGTQHICPPSAFMRLKARDEPKWDTYAPQLTLFPYSDDEDEPAGKSAAMAAGGGDEGAQITVFPYSDQEDEEGGGGAGGASGTGIEAVANLGQLVTLADVGLLRFEGGQEVYSLIRISTRVNDDGTYASTHASSPFGVNFAKQSDAVAARRLDMLTILNRIVEHLPLATVTAAAKVAGGGDCFEQQAHTSSSSGAWSGASAASAVSASATGAANSVKSRRSVTRLKNDGKDLDEKTVHLLLAEFGKNRPVFGNARYTWSIEQVTAVAQLPNLDPTLAPPPKPNAQPKSDPKSGVASAAAPAAAGRGAIRKFGTAAAACSDNADETPKKKQRQTKIDAKSNDDE